MKYFIPIIMSLLLLSCSNNSASIEELSFKLNQAKNQLQAKDSQISQLSSDLTQIRQENQVLLKTVEELKEQNKDDVSFLSTNLDLEGLYERIGGESNQIPEGFRVQKLGNGFWFESIETDGANGFNEAISAIHFFLPASDSNDQLMIWYDYREYFSIGDFDVTVLEVKMSDFGFSGIGYMDGNRESSFQVEYNKISEDPFFKIE